MRAGQIGDQGGAEEILGDFRNVLSGSIQGAFADYATVLREVPTVTGGLSSFTRARFIHDRTVHHLAVAEGSGDYPGLRLKKINGLYVVILRDALMLKLKKLDARLRSRNIRTGQTTAFDQQVPLLPKSFGVITNATSGYVTDEVGSEIVRAVVVCWDGPEKRWEFDLLASTGEDGIVVTIPAGPVPPDAPSRTRVVVEPPAAAEESPAE